MGIKLLVIVLLVQMVVARISLDVNVDQNQEVKVSYTGSDMSLITDDDINAFNIREKNLLPGLEEHMGRRPSDVFLKSPTPWGDLYKRHNWDQLQRVLTARSATVKRMSRAPVVVMTQDAENKSQRTIRVNAAISRTVDNTITTSWSEEHDLTFAHNVNYDINVELVKLGGTTGFSRSNTWGKSESKTITQTIGTSNSVEVDLPPGTAITAILTATAGNLEIEVDHEIYLTGDVALNFYPTHNGHYFYACDISDIPTNGGNKNKITTTETIKMDFFMSAKLTVIDKTTGLSIYEKLL